MISSMLLLLIAGAYADAWKLETAPRDCHRASQDSRVTVMPQRHELAEQFGVRVLQRPSSRRRRLCGCVSR